MAAAGGRAAAARIGATRRTLRVGRGRTGSPNDPTASSAHLATSGSELEDDADENPSSRGQKTTDTDGTAGASTSTARMTYARAWLEKERVTQESCKSLPFTALFYMSFFMVQIAHRDVGAVYPLTSALTSTMLTGVVPATMGEDVSSRPSGVALTDVKSWSDTLAYMERTVVPFLWASEEGGPGVVMGVNELIGGFRVQQWRVETVECVGAQALTDTYSSFMSSKYNISCRSAESAYQTHGIAGSTRSGNLSDEVVQGAHANTDTGAYTYWISNRFEGQRSSSAIALSHIEGLRENRWLSAATEAVALEFAMYCGQVGWFALVHVEFFMDRVGAFTATVKANGLQTEIWGSYKVVLCDLWFCLNLLWLCGGEIFGLRKALMQNTVSEHVFRFTRLINMSLIFGGCVLIPFFMWLFVRIGDVGDQLTSLLGTEVGQTDEAALSHFSMLDTAYDDMLYMTRAIRWNEMSAFWYSMIMLVKFFLNFNANERLAVITRTMTLSSEDLFHFMLIFLLVFFNFIIGAHFLFGQALKEWSSAILALCTGFRALMGDFDFMAMYNVAPFNSTMWFVVYMGFIFLVMVNMFVVIVMDAFLTVKEEAGKAESVFCLVKRQMKALKAKVTGGKEDSDGGPSAGPETSPDHFSRSLRKIDYIDSLLKMGTSGSHSTCSRQYVTTVAMELPQEAPATEQYTGHPVGFDSATQTRPQPLSLRGLLPHHPPPAASRGSTLDVAPIDLRAAPPCASPFTSDAPELGPVTDATPEQRRERQLAELQAQMDRHGVAFNRAAARKLLEQGERAAGAEVQFHPLPVVATFAPPCASASPPAGDAPELPPALPSPTRLATDTTLEQRRERQLVELQAQMSRHGLSFSPNVAKRLLR